MPRTHTSHTDLLETRKTVRLETGLTFMEYASNRMLVKNLVRSDVTHVTKDTTGWRNPSGYSVLDYQVEPFRGSRTVATRYKLLPFYDQDVVITGWQSDLPAPVFSDPNSLPWPSANEIARAEVSALLKVRDQKFNAALAIKEADKTAKLIGDRVFTLYSSYRHFRRGRFSEAAKALGIRGPKSGKGSANNWLEYQYGWMPLLQDIHGAYGEITRPYRYGGMPIGVKARVNSVEERKIVTPLDVFSVESQIQYQFRTQVCLWYRIDNEALFAASSVGMVNPLEIAWELTPWSFVVDWLIPIGDVLGALTATSGTTFIGGTRTLTTTGTCSDVLSGGSQTAEPGGVYERKITGTGNATQRRRIFKMQRSLYYSSPFPVPYYKSPISTGHALNALALLRGLFK